MIPISEIANNAVMKISNGSFTTLPLLGRTGLLNDFQIVWLQKLKVTNYDFNLLDIARRLCCGSEDKKVFKMTNCNSIDEIRLYFHNYLLKYHRNDNRVITSLRYDQSENRINAEWLPLNEYLDSIKSKTK